MRIPLLSKWEMSITNTGFAHSTIFHKLEMRITVKVVLCLIMMDWWCVLFKKNIKPPPVPEFQGSTPLRLGLRLG